MATLAKVGHLDHWVKKKVKIKEKIFKLNIFIVPFTYDLQ